MPMILDYCTYVLFSFKDRAFYVGFTSNLNNRLQDHHHGRVISTKNRRPLELVYSEYHQNKYDALRREKYLKSTAGKKGLRLMIRERLQEIIKSSL